MNERSGRRSATRAGCKHEATPMGMHGHGKPATPARPLPPSLGLSGRPPACPPEAGRRAAKEFSEIDEAPTAPASGGSAELRAESEKQGERARVVYCRSCCLPVPALTSGTAAPETFSRLFAHVHWCMMVAGDGGGCRPPRRWALGRRRHGRGQPVPTAKLACLPEARASAPASSARRRGRCITVAARRRSLAKQPLACPH